MNKIPLLFLITLLLSCKDQKSSHESISNSSTLRYAKGFWVENHPDYKDVFVRQSADSTGNVIHYRLIRNGSVPSSIENDIITIPVPVSSIVCTSTTHIPLLDYLGESEKLIGFPNTHYISSATMRKRVDAGLVKELGVEDNLNMEVLLTLQPSIVMSYTISNDLGALKKVKELGIPVVINAEFLELHPLGRAEWIKFMALFLGKEDKADSVFNWVEHEYLAHQKQASELENRPTVLTGIPYGGVWFLPGGKNYGATFFKDAGCTYIWEDDLSNGFLKLSLETVFEKALHADYWIGVGSFESYSDLKSLDDRFTKFSAFQNQKIYNYGKRVGPTGGNEYLELGYLRPDLILNDLIQITHPEKFPSPDLFFYQALN